MSLTYAPVEEELERRPMSREEFESLPEGPPYYDYVDGLCIKVNRPTLRHGRISVKLGNFLMDTVEASYRGVVASEVDVRLPNGNWYGPDIIYLGPDKIQLVDDKGEVRGT